MLVECLLLCGLLYLLWYQRTKPHPRLPPAPPIRLPIIGHLPYFIFTKKSGNERLHELYKQYGKEVGAMHFEIGSYKVVVVGDFDLMKEMLRRDEFNHRHRRPEGSVFSSYVMMKKMNEGILTSWGDVWKGERRFFLSRMRDFGFGKSSMANVIQEEAGHFINYIRETVKEGGTLEIQNSFNICIVNCLWKLVAGYSFEYNDPELIQLTQLMSQIIATLGLQNRLITLAFPSLQEWLIKVGYFEKTKEPFKQLREIFDRTIVEHKKTFDGNNPRDFIDAYLQRIQEEKDELADDSSLKAVMVDLFFAGSETTSSTLSWAIIFLIRHPEVQQKVRAEVLQVIGPEGVPSISHREHMPFTDATIMEIQRCANMVPFALPRTSAWHGAELGKFYIPKGYYLFPSLTNVMQSATYWDEPERFDPDRHLDGNGRLKKQDHFIPFSTGRRQCLGEQLSKFEIFIFLCMLLQNFEFLPETPGKLPGTECLSGITQYPVAFKTRLVPVRAK